MGGRRRRLGSQILVHGWLCIDGWIMKVDGLQMDRETDICLVNGRNGWMIGQTDRDRLTGGHKLSK